MNIKYLSTVIYNRNEIAHHVEIFMYWGDGVFPTLYHLLTRWGDKIPIQATQTHEGGWITCEIGGYFYVYPTNNFFKLFPTEFIKLLSLTNSTFFYIKIKHNLIPFYIWSKLRSSHLPYYLHFYVACNVLFTYFFRLCWSLISPLSA